MSQGQARYFPNVSPPYEALSSVPDSRVELIYSLEKLVTGCPPTKPWSSSFLDGRHAGLFTGPTSIALLFFYLSSSHPELLLHGKDSKYWCNAYLACGAPPLKATPERQSCGITNEFLAFHTVSAAFERDPNHARLVIDALRDIQIDPCLCEWMRGRAGALYFLRFLGKYLPNLKAELEPVQEAIILQLLNARPWKFNEKRYIGAVHGDIGIITQAVLTEPSHAVDFEPELRGMLDAQEEDGNWPTRLHDGNSLIQFCHGAPGFIVSLLPLRAYFPALQGRIDSAVARARACTWSEGLLTKEPSLCHGSTGNALALEDSQMEHFMAASMRDKLAQGIKDGIYEMSYDPWGLLWGEAGRAWSWALLDQTRKGGTALRGVLSYTDV